MNSLGVIFLLTLMIDTIFSHQIPSTKTLYSQKFIYLLYQNSLVIQQKLNNYLSSHLKDYGTDSQRRKRFCSVSKGKLSGKTQETTFICLVVSLLYYCFEAVNFEHVTIPFLGAGCHIRVTFLNRCLQETYRYGQFE